MTFHGTTLLLIDCQKDFHPGGSLAIPTANEDAERIAALIRGMGGKLNRIVATLDSHQKLHIAHPCFWLSGDGGEKHPPPFTIISADDIRQGVWKPRSDLKLPQDGSSNLDPTIFKGAEAFTHDAHTINLHSYCLEYALRLESKGRFKICIWPEHCIIGSEGHALVDSIRTALSNWSELTGRTVEWVMKGQNILTEMYSALEADVPVSSETSFNEGLHKSLLTSERLLVCGQAMSHCVNYTLRDLVDHCPPNRHSSITLLTDCASAVPGFEDAATSFEGDMEKAGVQLSLSSNIN